jgi:hypothetical protein
MLPMEALSSLKVCCLNWNSSQNTKVEEYIIKFHSFFFFFSANQIKHIYRREKERGYLCWIGI